MGISLAWTGGASGQAPPGITLAAWKTMNRAMTEEPPEARHAALLKLFATIGVGPNQQVERLDEQIATYVGNN